MWLGLQRDNTDLTVALPALKVQKALEWAHFLRNSKKVTRKQLDSATGFLRIVRTGPAHEVRIYIDAHGGSGGIGVFVQGGCLGFTGAEINALYP